MIRISFIHWITCTYSRNCHIWLQWIFLQFSHPFNCSNGHNHWLFNIIRSDWFFCKSPFQLLCMPTQLNDIMYSISCGIGHLIHNQYHSDITNNDRYQYNIWYRCITNNHIIYLLAIYCIECLLLLLCFVVSDCSFCFSLQDANTLWKYFWWTISLHFVFPLPDTSKP